MLDTEVTSYKCTARQTRAFAIEIMEAGLVPYVRSSPAMGKSALFHSIANEYGLELIDHRLSTSAPEDLSGLANFVNKVNPETGETYTIASYVPFDTFPITSTPIPKGKNGWLLFLDEMNSANKAVIAAAYKLILDKAVGLNKLHPAVFIACAGNLDTDRAITTTIGTAMESRVIHIEMVVNHEEFIQDICYGLNWDQRIPGYLEYKKEHLNTFKPDHNDKTFAAPRTWGFMNKLITGKEVTVEKTSLYAGTIGSGVASEFVQFTEYYTKLPKINDILYDPEQCPIPVEKPLRFATMVHVQSHVDESSIDQIGKYIARFPSEFMIVFTRGLFYRQPELRKHPGMRKIVTSIGKYIYD